MYEYAISETTSLYVGIYSGKTRDEDYQKCVQSMYEFERAQRVDAMGIAAVIVNDPEVPPVPPAWRQQMAEFNDSVQASSYLLSIVTPSPLIRGILTAINWMAPARPGHKRFAHDTFEHGCAWIEKERGRDEPELVELYRKARSSLSRRATG